MQGGDYCFIPIRSQLELDLMDTFQQPHSNYPDLEIKQVRELHNECPLDKRAVSRVSTVVVHDIQIA
jgi:hypothetical protein